MSLLNELALKYGTDKSSEIHNYCDKYDKILFSLREQFTNILEIGVDKGFSLKMWEEYFPNALIYGVDINSECKKYETDRVKVIITDQGDDLQLKKVGEEYGLFDMILDDGSHKHKHQITSYKALFPFVKNKGLYIIEDLFSSYFITYPTTSDFGETKFHLTSGIPDNGFINPTTIDYLKTLIDDVNFISSCFFDPKNYIWYKQAGRREDFYINLPYIESIHFMNSTAIIYRR